MKTAEDWKHWVRFVLGPNNPTADIDDETLRTSVCAAWDELTTEIAALKESKQIYIDLTADECADKNTLREKLTEVQSWLQHDKACAEKDGWSHTHQGTIDARLRDVNDALNSV